MRRLLSPVLVPGAARHTLEASPGTAPLVGGQYPDTAVWCNGGAMSGPPIRARQGERVRIDAVNGLEMPTTIHWHGLSVPNAMDGVPHLTQEPIAPGGRFA